MNVGVSAFVLVGVLFAWIWKESFFILNLSLSSSFCVGVCQLVCLFVLSACLSVSLFVCLTVWSVCLLVC